MGTDINHLRSVPGLHSGLANLIRVLGRQAHSCSRQTIICDPYIPGQWKTDYHKNCKSPTRERSADALTGPSFLWSPVKQANLYYDCFSSQQYKREQEYEDILSKYQDLKMAPSKSTSDMANKLETGNTSRHSEQFEKMDGPVSRSEITEIKQLIKKNDDENTQRFQEMLNIMKDFSTRDFCRATCDRVDRTIRDAEDISENVTEEESILSNSLYSEVSSTNDVATTSSSSALIGQSGSDKSISKYSSKSSIKLKRKDDARNKIILTVCDTPMTIQDLVEISSLVTDVIILESVNDLVKRNQYSIPSLRANEIEVRTRGTDETPFTSILSSGTNSNTDLTKTASFELNIRKSQGSQFREHNVELSTPMENVQRQRQSTATSSHSKKSTISKFKQSINSNNSSNIKEDNNIKASFTSNKFSIENTYTCDREESIECFDYETDSTILFYARITENAFAPVKESYHAAGFMLRSAYNYDIPPRSKVIVKTDLLVELPKGSYGRIAPRKCLAEHFGIDVGADVIDRDHKDNVAVLLFNHSDKPYKVEKGHKVAQLICESINQVAAIEKFDLLKS